MQLMLLVQREVIPGEQSKLRSLLKELRSEATRRPAFISGQTVMDMHSPVRFMTISQWSSIAGWEEWRDSAERQRFIEKIDRLLQDVPKVSLWVSGEEVPTFEA